MRSQFVRSIRLCAALLVACSFPGIVSAQSDSLFMSNGDILVGELKEMNRSLGTLKTPYSQEDNNFKIDWDEVHMVRTTSNYLVQMSHGERYTAFLFSQDKETMLLRTEDGTISVSFRDIVYLKSVKPDFWSRADASVDFGFNYTKANNLQQFNTRSKLGFQTDKWNTSTTFNKVRSTQDGVEPTQRTDFSGNFRWILQRNYFIAVEASFLSNTEQLLDLRSSYQPTIGYYFARTNNMYLMGSIGAAYTNEDYSSDEPVRRGTEGLFGIELNLFDIGNLNLLLASKALPGFTEQGRWRMDHNFDMKYDLPLDLYVRGGITLNYDNRPVEGAVETDYVIQTAIGWEL